MEPTQQQINNTLLTVEGKDVLIKAGAGVGKSSSLRYTAEQIAATGKNLLVLTFNAANAEETRNHPDRPSNLFACTVHSIAYRAIMNDKLKGKKIQPWLSYKDIDLTEVFAMLNTNGLPAKKVRSYNIHVQKVTLDSITSFCRSNSDNVYYHVHNYIYFRLIDRSENDLKVTRDIVDKLALIANNFWLQLTDKKSKVGITADVYLKVFQLANIPIRQVYDVTLKELVKVDLIVIDEAQDSNPVTEAIFKQQKHLQKIIVGDPNQQLYAWRGAGLTMDNFPDFTVGYLTESFRFGPAIAGMANVVLKLNKADFTLTGSGKPTVIKSKAILCRTNARVVETIFAILLNDNNSLIYTSIDLKSTFSKLFHLDACYYNQQPKFPLAELAAITDYDSLQEAIKYSDEINNLVRLVQLLKNKAGTLWKAKQMVEGRLTDSIGKADLTVSTIHASKGLEWDYVSISDDLFPRVKDEDGNSYIDTTECLGKEELRCLLYVAITRSRVRCDVPEYLQYLFE